MIIDRKVLNNHLNDIHDELFLLYYDDFFFGYKLVLSGQKNSLPLVKLNLFMMTSFMESVSAPNGKYMAFCRNLLLLRKLFTRPCIFSVLL